VTRMDAEKQALVARTAATCAAGWEPVSARADEGVATIAMTNATPAVGMITGAKALMAHT
jgi:LDH2 family malate/lactate/ureidoglycolate dehydrogenase